MQNLIIALVVVVGGLWLLRKFAKTPPNKMLGLLRKAGGAALMAIAGILMLRGAMNAAVPLFVVGAGLYGLSGGFPGNFGWGRKAPGQRSRVETSWLAMELDHDTGTMDGVVKLGVLRDRKLSELSEDELKSLYRSCGTVNDQSVALLEAWLDRSRAGWRDRWKAGRETRNTTSTTMSKEEAYSVLGLKPGADEGEIRKAHRRLMKEFHPDHGGSDYLAAKINQAKDVLLQP
jgi:hypothetical protein